MSEPAILAAWRERGRSLDVFGLRVFVVDASARDEQERGEPLLVLHGFPTASFDFCEVLEELRAHRRVILFDFPGFGLSAKPAVEAYSLLEQAEVAIGVWRALGVESGHLLAHDYGTSVATELLARRERDLLPVTLRSVTLTNGSPHIELAQLTATQKVLRHPKAGPVLARLSSEGFFRARMRKLLGRRDAVSKEHLAAMWAGMRTEEGHLRLPAISQYLHERRRFWHRWVGALTRLDLPTHVVWGRRDPIAVPAIAEALQADVFGAELTWLDDLGHYPMLEDPSAWAAPVAAFVRNHDPAS